jgi:hypothetical protein
MRGDLVCLRRTGSGTGRSGRPELSGCVRPGLVQADPVVTWLVTGLRHHGCDWHCGTSLLNNWRQQGGWDAAAAGGEARWACLPRTAVCFLELPPGRLSASGIRSRNGACEALGSPCGRPVAGRSATLESGRTEVVTSTSAEYRHDRGGGEDLLPLEELIRQTPGAHPAGSAGELRCDAFETGQELLGVPGVRLPGASCRPCLSRPFGR